MYVTSYKVRNTFTYILFLFCGNEKVKVSQLCPTLCDPGQNTGVGSLSLLQGIFPTQVSRIAGRFFSSWATREAQEYRSGEPIPSPVGLPNPGIKLESATVQEDSLPSYHRSPLFCKGWQVSKHMKLCFSLGSCTIFPLSPLLSRFVFPLLVFSTCDGDLVAQSDLTLVTPQTTACQAPLSMGFSRQECWSRLPFLSPGDLPDPQGNSS